MKKMMKRWMVFLLSLLMVFSAMACKKGGDISSDNKTLNIRVYKAGYGDDFVRALIAAFESTYAEEGYKINIVSSDTTIQATTVTNELLLGENNGIDLYIAGNVSPDTLVTVSKANNMDMIAADLTDVYASTPIKADKTEEDITILEKLKNGYADYQRYDGEEKEYQGKYYGFTYRSSPTGFIVNTDLLQSYGLEVPRTTDELTACFKAIYAKKAETGVYPTAWAGYNAYQYWDMVRDVWAAQYSGVENYNKFCSMSYSDNIEDGWKVYEDKGWVESLNVLGTYVNLDYAMDKTINMDHTTAQHHFLSGNAVFMVNGAWLQNEMAANYLEQASGMTMIKTPVISSLGAKIGLSNDAVLSQIVELVDEGKTVDEIVQAVGGVTTEQVKTVKEARNIFCDWGCADAIVVNAHSEKMDLAKLFLRYIASDDAINLIYEYASSYTPFKTLTEMETTDSTSKFMASIHAISSTEDAQFIYNHTSGMRHLFAINTFNKYELVKDLATAKGTLSGETIMQDELKYVKEVWERRVKEYKKK